MGCAFTAVLRVPALVSAAHRTERPRRWTAGAADIGYLPDGYPQYRFDPIPVKDRSCPAEVRDLASELTWRGSAGDRRQQRGTPGTADASRDGPAPDRVLVAGHVAQCARGSPRVLQEQGQRARRGPRRTGTARRDRLESLVRRSP